MEKIGRNLILFQRIEHALKGLITLGSISYSSTTGVRPSPHQKQSLGLAAKSFVERHLCSSAPAFPLADREDDEVILQSSFQIEGTAAQDLTERIERAVPDRNRLAHLVIKDFDLSTEAGAYAAITWLDESYAEHAPLLETLRNHHREVREAFQAVVSFLQSEQGIDEMLLPDIQSAPIIQRMLRAAKASTPPDSWISVAAAAKGESKSEVQEALECFGKKSLTGLMLASRLFELKAEETTNGGTRMLYRLASSAAPLPSNS